MHRSRFSLQPKPSNPKTSPTKGTRKLPKIEPKPAPETPIPTPDVVLGASQQSSADIAKPSIFDSSDDSYSDDDERYEEMEEGIDDEMEELKGCTHQELIDMYRAQYNLFLDNIDKVTEIINQKLTTV